jgi:hypothetical protein
MLRYDDYAGISELLRANGYPDDKEFVAQVVHRADEDYDLHIQIDHLLESALCVQRQMEELDQMAGRIADEAARRRGDA